MKFAFYTLGCKTNQYETQAMERLLTAMGHELGHFDEACDGYVINTCSVTAVADKKNRAIIRRCRRDNPQAIIGVCGCYSQHAPEAVRELGIDVIGGSGGREEFLEMMLGALADRSHREKLDNALRRREFEILPAGGLEERTRAMVKVQDGCVNFCSYCIIPFARGRIRSLPLEQAVEQAKSLWEQGYKEIVITGIEISSWGQEWRNESALIDLMEGICAAVPQCRIRLGSLEPRTITAEFCARASKLPNLCPHFHLSMQSGCDTVLKRMNRKYDSARYFESVKLLREYFKNPGITTDLIVGFPGETEEEFVQTLDFIRRCAFSAMHVFPYSKRPGTPAAARKDQILNTVKEERAHRAAAVAAEMEEAYLDSWVGQTVPVLMEEERDGAWRGYTAEYVPVAVSAQEDLHNQIRQVRLERGEKGVLWGSLA